MANSSNQKPSGCAALFGLPFLAFGLVMSWFYFTGYVEWIAARSWEEVPCWIDSVEVESGGKASRTKATYRYWFQGQTYSGDRVGFESGYDNIGKFQRVVYSELLHYADKKGGTRAADVREENRKPFRCYVNPAHPAESVLYRSLRWEMQACKTLFALGFSTIGGATVVAVFLESRKQKQEAELRRKYPHSVWKWKMVWAGDAITETVGAGNWVHFYNTWATLIIGPLLVSAIASGALTSIGMVAAFVVFAAGWVFGLRFSIRRLLHASVVGSARLELRPFPSRPGGELKGEIVFAKANALKNSATVTVNCVKKVTEQAGGKRLVVSETVWTREQEVRPDAYLGDLRECRVPINFVLPADAPESGVANDDDVEHVWEVELKSSEPGVQSKFEVPVYRTEFGSPAPRETQAVGPTILEEQEAQLAALLRQCRLNVEFDNQGFPVSIISPPCRFPGLLLLILTVSVVLSWVSFGPLLGPLFKANNTPVIALVFPAFALLFWCGVIEYSLHKRSVSFDSRGLEIRNQLGPFGTRTAVQKSEIKTFSHKSEGTSTVGNECTTYYRVRLETASGKKQTIVSRLQGSTTVAALVRRLELWKNA